MKVKGLFKLIPLVLSIALVTAIMNSCDYMGQSKRVSITGKILKPKSDSVFVQVNENNTYVNYGKAILDEQGHFTMSFSLEKPVNMRFFDKNESSQMYVFPGDEIHITVDTEQFDETISYAGTSANENNFLAANYLKHHDWDQGNPIDFYTQAKELPIDEYYAFVKNNTEKRLTEFSEFNNINEFGESFIQYFSNRLFVEDLNALLYVYFGSQEMDSIPEIRRMKYKIAKEIIEAKGRINSTIDPVSYQRFCLNDIPVVVNKLVYLDHPELKRKNIDSLYYPELARLLNESELNEYIFDDNQYRLKDNNITYYESKLLIIQEYLKDEKLRSELEKQYNALKEKLTKGYAAGLNMQDFGSEENINRTLDDILAKYNGKVIYLDIWASWCGPCKAELPYSKDLKKKLEGKDVVFVYLSTDKKLEDWKNIMILMQLEGEHYRANPSIHQYLAKEYDLKYIPHYIIFDQEGKLVKNNAARPSSEEIVGELEALL